MQEKIIGYVLLVLGIILLCYSAFDVYQVFTKQKKPIQLFNFSGISVDLAKLAPQGASLDISSLLPQGTQQEVLTQLQNSQKPQAAGEATQEIISKDMVNQPMNIFAHLMLMGFVSTVGLKIATVGTYLIRPIIVKVKEEKQQTTNTP